MDGFDSVGRRRTLDDGTRWDPLRRVFQVAAIVAVVVGVTVAHREAQPAPLRFVASPMATPLASPIASPAAFLPGGPGTNPAPLPLGDGFDLLYYYFADDGGTPVVLGEVRNTTGEAAIAPLLRFTLLDAAGNVYGEVTAAPLYALVSPGERMPFLERFPSDAPARGQWQTEAISPCASTYTPEELDTTGLRIENVREEQRAGMKVPIEGFVHNARAMAAEDLIVRAAFYAADGRFIGSSDSLIPFSIPPGKSGRFTQGLSANALVGLEPGEARGGVSYRLTVGVSQGMTFLTCGAPVT